MLRYALQLASAYLLDSQRTQAKVMQLEGRFDMRGLMGMTNISESIVNNNHVPRCTSTFFSLELCFVIDTVEQKYRARYEFDPTMESMAGVGREGLWRVRFKQKSGAVKTSFLQTSAFWWVGS